MKRSILLLLFFLTTLFSFGGNISFADSIKNILAFPGCYGEDTFFVSIPDTILLNTADTPWTAYGNGGWEMALIGDSLMVTPSMVSAQGAGNFIITSIAGIYGTCIIVTPNWVKDTTLPSPPTICNFDTGYLSATYDNNATRYLWNIDGTMDTTSANSMSWAPDSYNVFNGPTGITAQYYDTANRCTYVNKIIANVYGLALPSTSICFVTAYWVNGEPTDSNEVVWYPAADSTIAYWILTSSNPSPADSTRNIFYDTDSIRNHFFSNGNISNEWTYTLTIVTVCGDTEKFGNGFAGIDNIYLQVNQDTTTAILSWNDPGYVNSEGYADMLWTIYKKDYGDTTFASSNLYVPPVGNDGYQAIDYSSNAFRQYYVTATIVGCSPNSDSVLVYSNKAPSNTTAPTAVNNLSSFSSVKIYPNPSTGTFYFSGVPTGANVQVYNVLGEMVYSSMSTYNNYSLNLNSQAKGIYFYRVMDNGSATGQTCLPGLESLRGWQGKIIIE